MSYKVLFLESKNFYQDMIDPVFFENCQFEFDGGLHRSNSSYFSDFHLVVYTIFSSPAYNLIIQRCVNYDIPTLLLFDGICEFSNFTKNPVIQQLDLDNYHPIIADKIAVVGDEALNYFQALNCTVYKYLPPRVFRMNEKLPLLDNNDGYDFLITTANTAYYDDKEKKALILLLEQLIGQLDMSTYSYCFRLFDASLLSALDVPESLNFIDGDFDSVLSQVRSVITTPSSILLSAMFHERAVALLSYRDSPIFIQSGWLMHTGGDFTQTLQSMQLRDPKRMAFQLSQVKSNIESEPLLKVCDVTAQSTFDKKELVKFINQNMHNMLNSPFNFNVEHRFRKLFWFVKSSRFFHLIKPITNYLKR